MEQEQISGILTGILYKDDEPYIGLQTEVGRVVLLSPDAADHLIENLIVHLMFIGYESEQDEFSDKEKLH